MSLFEDEQYEYQETLFIFLDRENRPDADTIHNSVQDLGPRFEIADFRNSSGRLDSMMIRSPQDFSAMDIVFVDGGEVQTQIQEVLDDFRSVTLASDDKEKLDRIKTCDSRIDVFHFAKKQSGGSGEDELLDPGGLFLVMGRLAELCDGIALDPQSQQLL